MNAPNSLGPSVPIWKVGPRPPPPHKTVWGEQSPCTGVPDSPSIPSPLGSRYYQHLRFADGKTEVHVTCIWRNWDQNTLHPPPLLGFLFSDTTDGALRKKRRAERRELGDEARWREAAAP